jgi:hypothetical protein
MMDMEFSNKTLAWLVVATIVVSLAGTIISLNKLNESGVTGFASNNKTGNATVNINSQTTLNFAVSGLNFGTGQINTSLPNGQYCNMSSNQTSGTTINWAGGCSGFNNVVPANGWLQLENAGTTIMNVTLNFSANAANFIGGSLSPSFKFSVSNNESNSCTGINTSLSNWVEVWNWTQGLATICTGTPAQGLQPGDAGDSISIGIFVGIPFDAVGNKIVTIVATGSNQ